MHTQGLECHDRSHLERSYGSRVRLRGCGPTRDVSRRRRRELDLGTWCSGRSRKGAAVGSILSDADRAAIRQRIDSVTSASVPRWGRMDAKAMLTHLRQSALMALGELPVACKSQRVFQVFP